MLLVFAGQMTRSLQRLLAVDQGLQIDTVAVVEPSLEEFGVEPAARAAYWDEVRARIASHPEVEQTALVASSVLSDSGSTTKYAVANHLTFRMLSVSPEFFSTLRVPLVAGRGFMPTDDGDSAVIISRRAALEMYGTLDVLGQRFPKGSNGPAVVGLAADAAVSSLRNPSLVERYEPLSIDHAHVLLVRARNDPTVLLPHLRDAARSADARVVPDVRLLRDDFSRMLEAPRRASALAGATAFLALALSCVGIFGVVAYGAGLRTKEVGIRLALGAERRSIVRLLLRPTWWAAAAGMLLGLIGGWPAGHALSGAPFYLQSLDVAAYALAGLTFVAAGSMAALVPAWRTLRGNPLAALRHE